MAVGYIIRTLVPSVSPYDLAYPVVDSFASDQYKLVADNGTKLVLATTDANIGILQDAPNLGTTGNVASVRTVGLSKLILAADCSPGDFLKNNGAGLGTPASAGDFYSAYSLDGGLAGEAIAVVIQHGQLDS